MTEPQDIHAFTRLMEELGSLARERGLSDRMLETWRELDRKHGTNHAALLETFIKPKVER